MKWDELRHAVAHRPWPLPAPPWFMTMSWCDLLFAHWSLPAERLRPLLPRGLELDLYGGRAWLSLVPFRMAHVGPRGLSDLPWISAFPELNLRTYAVADGKPGVWFFSLDAANPVAVTLARAAFHLPYFRAQMSLRADGDAIDYASERTHAGAPPARFEARYAPVGETFQAAPGSLDHWLTERYCLYAATASTLYRSEIHHPPWTLRRAELTIGTNTVVAAAGLDLSGAAPAEAPLLHFSRQQDVIAWRPTRVR